MIPKEVGWYWVRRPRRFHYKDEPEWVVEFIRDYAGRMAIGNTVIEGWPAYEDAEFVGPLTPPGE